MPDAQYPKSPDELQAEIIALKGKLATAEGLLKIAADELKLKDEAIAVLRRRKPPRVLDKDAADAFQRPAFSR